MLGVLVHFWGCARAVRTLLSRLPIVVWHVEVYRVVVRSGQPARAVHNMLPKLVSDVEVRRKLVPKYKSSTRAVCAMHGEAVAGSATAATAASRDRRRS